MKRIDPKYSIEIRDGEPVIVNLAGVPIPEDEPLMLFRGRDAFALRGALIPYLKEAIEAGCTDFHIAGCMNRIKAFRDFAIHQPKRMKQPGITEGK